MVRFTAKSFGRRLLLYATVAVAALAMLVAGLSGRANAASYDPEELQFLELINGYRADNGLGRLILSDTLAVAAERHSLDMARYSFFAHNTEDSSYYADGAQPWDRMAAEGYDYNTYKGENIAVGYETAEEAFQAWRESPSHNRAMLDGRYRVIGIARINDSDSVHGWYWTTDFGGAVDPTSHAAGEDASPANPGDEPQGGGDDSEEPLEDGPGLENGELNGKAVWEQEAKDGAELILDGYARLGDYDDGADRLYQKIRVRDDSRLTYEIKVQTRERRHPSDRLVVRLTDREGEEISVLERHTDEDAGTRSREVVDLSDFAGQTVYLSFDVETDRMLRTAFYLDHVSLRESP